MTNAQSLTSSDRPVNAPQYFHVLAKPTGAICNLDCEYCFFLSKEALYPGSPFRMQEDVLETYIKQLIESQQTPQVTIAWQGGEPTLMGLDFYRRTIELVEKYRRPGQVFDGVEHHRLAGTPDPDEQRGVVGVGRAGGQRVVDVFEDLDNDPVLGKQRGYPLGQQLLSEIDQHLLAAVFELLDECFTKDDVALADSELATEVENCDVTDLAFCDIHVSPFRLG